MVESFVLVDMEIGSGRWEIVFGCFDDLGVENFIGFIFRNMLISGGYYVVKMLYLVVENLEVLRGFGVVRVGLVGFFEGRRSDKFLFLWYFVVLVTSFFLEYLFG